MQEHTDSQHVKGLFLSNHSTYMLFTSLQLYTEISANTKKEVKSCYCPLKMYSLDFQHLENPSTLSDFSTTKIFSSDTSLPIADIDMMQTTGEFWSGKICWWPDQSFHNSISKCYGLSTCDF